MTVSGKNRFIPMEVDEQAINDLGISREDIRKMKIGCRMVDAVMVPCTEPEYRNYMRGEWKEEQRAFRESKCMVPSEKTGKPVRCAKSCKNCERMRSGAAFSLDAFEDEFEYEPEDLNRQVTNECDAALTLMLMDDLVAGLRAQSPELADIFTMLLDGETHQAIADTLGKPKQTITDLISRLRKQLQEKVSRSDITG